MMQNTNFDFLIVGAGVFGLSAAIELRKRAYRVAILNPDTIPHSLAASTDISKIVRMEYGTDSLYFEMAEASIKLWKEWNQRLGRILYNEVGFILLGQEAFDSPRQKYERDSIRQLNAKGYQSEILDAKALKERFPAFNSNKFRYASFNPKGGYVKSGEVIRHWAAYARQIGVEVLERNEVVKLEIEKGRLNSVLSSTGQSFSAGQTIIAAGAYTAALVPGMEAYMCATGHPVFHIRPANPKLFEYQNLPVFTADISNTGWYGFPLHPDEGVVKISQHSNGLLLNPKTDNRRVDDAAVQNFRLFLKELFPAEVEAPLVFTRICTYCDTLDGDFWIDQHPEIQGLSVASGGSGHGMKMGPVLGRVIADMAEQKSNPYQERFKWRDLKKDQVQKEEARYIIGGTLT